MHWYLAAPFIVSAEDAWLTRYVPNVDGRLEFHPVPAAYSHDRSRKISGLREWQDYFSHGSTTWNVARRAKGDFGVLTCFPQLPIIVGLRKRIARSDAPIVAWNFNLGTLYGGVKGHLARYALASVDRMIVHSRAEITAYSEWLDLPASRFRFVPLQRAVRAITEVEDERDPFVLSMGSAQRDYRLLFGAMAELKYRTIVVAGPHAVQGLTVPPNVEVRSGLTNEECQRLAQRARVNVIPVANTRTASGQVTLIDAMMFGKATIVTRAPVSVDYATHDHDALLVEHGDHSEMKRAIEMLWEDRALRERVGAQARRTAVEKFSDEAVGRELGDALSDVELKRS